MAFRLGHQITCNINKNLFFRNSTAGVRRYRSLSRGGGTSSSARGNGTKKASEDLLRGDDNPRARSHPRHVARRDYVTDSSASRHRTTSQRSTSQQQQQQQQQQERTNPAYGSALAIKKGATPGCHSLQPKNLQPMATTTIHMNSTFGSTDDLYDVRPYENRLDEVQKQASAKYERAVKTFNIHGGAGAGGPGAGSSAYRYELDAAKPKVEKGTNVYNVVAAIKNREQSIAAQAPQLQPKNIRPYGDIMSRPWCSPIMERIKHKPLSITRLEEAIHRSILRKDSYSKLPEPVQDDQVDAQPKQELGKAATVEEVAESPRASSSEMKPIDEVMRKSYSTRCYSRSFCSAIHHGITVTPKDDQVNFSMKSKSPPVDDVLCYTKNQPKKVFCVTDKLNAQFDLNVNKLVSKPFHRPSDPDSLSSKEIKVTVGPKLKLQSWNLEDKAVSEKSLMPGLGEKFSVPWISWSDRVKAQAKADGGLEKAISRPKKLNHFGKKPSPSVPLTALTVRNYSTWFARKQSEVDRILVPARRVDFIPEIDFPEFSNPFCYTQIRHQTSTGTGIPEECDCGVKPIPPGKKPVPDHICDPIKYPPNPGPKDCKKGCVLGPEYTVMVNLRRLPKIKFPDPIRLCPKPCDEQVRADDGLKVVPKVLPKLEVKPCPPVPVPCMTDVPLKRLKRRDLPPLVRICPGPPCRDPRADDGLKVKKKRLPKLVPKMCGRCEEVIMTSPPLFRLKSRPVPPPKPCVMPPPCPEPNLRADAGMKVVRKNLPVLTPPCCPRMCDDHLVDGPPLPRLKCMCVLEEAKICPCVPTARQPCCPPRFDEICNYTVTKKTLPTMILSARHNEMSVAEFARLKKKELKEGKRRFSTYVKSDMCCFSDKKVQPDVEAMKNDISASEWDKFGGCFTVENDGSIIETYGKADEVIDKDQSSKGIDLRVIKKPIGTKPVKTDISDRLLKSGYCAKFIHTSARNYSSFSYPEVLDDCPPPQCVKKFAFNYPKLKRLKKCTDASNLSSWQQEKACAIEKCTDSEIEVVPRMDDVLNYHVSRKTLPVIPAGNCQKVVRCRNMDEPPMSLERPKKRCDYVIPPPECVVRTDIECTPRADDFAPIKQRKPLPPVPMSKCLPVKRFKYKEGKELVRLSFRSADPPRPEKVAKCPPDECPERADAGKDLITRKRLPTYKAAQLPPREPMKYRDCAPLKRLHMPDFLEKGLTKCPPDECEEVIRADDTWIEVRKVLPPILRNDGKFLDFCNPNVALPCPIDQKRKYSTLATPRFPSNPDIIPGRFVSNASIFQEKDCKIKKEEKKEEKKCAKFAMPFCKPAQDPPFCDRDVVYPECTKLNPPYPSFSECKDDDPYIGLTECAKNDKHLQPKFPLIGNIAVLKPPPPAQRKIDPKLEEECIIKRLNIKRENIGTRTCDDFNKPYVPLRSKELMQQAMKQARAQANAASAQQDMASCEAGDVDCQLIEKDQDPLLCGAVKQKLKQKRSKGTLGGVICTATIKDCVPKAEGKKKMVPCKPYVPVPSPPKKLVCPKPQFCEQPVPQPKTDKKAAADDCHEPEKPPTQPKKKTTTSKVQKPKGGGPGSGSSCNSSGGGQVRCVGGCGGGSADPCKQQSEEERAKEEEETLKACAEICERKQKEKEAKLQEEEEKVAAAGEVCAKLLEAKKEEEKKKCKKEAKDSGRKKCKKLVAPACSVKKSGKKQGKGKKDQDGSKKKVCAGPKAKKASGGPKSGKECKKPKSAKKKCKAIAIKCAPIKKSPAKPCPAAKMKCSVQPAPIVSKACPEKTLWDKIMDFFKARPGCPAPDQWKKDKLKRDAELAAAAAGFDLIAKKQVCTVKKKEVKVDAKAGAAELDVDKKKACPFPPPPKAAKPEETTKKEAQDGGSKSCGSDKKKSGKKTKAEFKFKCKPKGSNKKKSSKSGGNSSCGYSNLSGAKKSCANTNTNESSPSVLSYPSSPRYPMKCGESLSNLPIVDCIERSGIFAKSKSADLSKQTRAFSTSLALDYSSPRDDECRGKRKSAPKCKVGRQKCCPPPRCNYDCDMRVPYPPCTPNVAPYPSFSECQKECCKETRTECNEQTRVLRRQQRAGLLNMSGLKSNRKIKHFSTAHLHPSADCASFVPNRGYSMIAVGGASVRKGNDVKENATVPSVFDVVKRFFWKSPETTETAEMAETAARKSDEPHDHHHHPASSSNLSPGPSVDLQRHLSKPLVRAFSTDAALCEIFSDARRHYHKDDKDGDGAGKQDDHMSAPPGKDCPKLRPDVKTKCKIPKPPTCGPNPRGFDCDIKAPYPPCTAQQAPYPSFSECQKECCRRVKNECTCQDMRFEKMKRTGQLNLSTLKGKKPVGQQFSTLARRNFSSFLGGCGSRPVGEEDATRFVKTAASEAFVRGHVARAFQTLPPPALAIMNNESGFANFAITAGSIGVGLGPRMCSSIRGFATAAASQPIRPYSKPQSPKERAEAAAAAALATKQELCEAAERREVGDKCKLPPQGCCQPRARETCEVHHQYPDCKAVETPYESFSDCNRVFPPLPIDECTEQDRVFLEHKRNGDFDVAKAAAEARKKKKNRGLDDCGLRIANECSGKKPAAAPADKCDVGLKKKYSTSAQRLLVDAVDGVCEEEQEAACASREDGEDAGRAKIVDVSPLESDTSIDQDGSDSCAENSYVSEVAGKISSDLPLAVGRTIFSRSLSYATGVVVGGAPAVAGRGFARAFATDGAGGKKQSAAKQADCKVDDGEANKCRMPAQPCCEPKYRETCEVDKTHPQCSAIDPPYASFSECQRMFSMLPTSECSEQEKVFMKLRSSGAYELKNLKRMKGTSMIKKAGPQKRQFSSCPKNDDSSTRASAAALERDVADEPRRDALGKEDDEKKLAREVLRAVRDGMEAIAVSASDGEAQDAYFRLYEELERLCDREFGRDAAAERQRRHQPPICSRDIFSDRCLNKNTVPSLADENLKQMMTIDAVKNFCTSMFTIPTMSTAAYEETEKCKTEKLVKQLDDLLDEYRSQ